MDRAGRFRLSHLGSNPALSIAASERVYKSWTENVIEGKYGDVVAVARIRDKVVGFFAWLRDAEVANRDGVDLLNRSWAVVSAEGQGALRAMTAAVVDRPASGERWVECETQVDNMPMNAAINQIGVGPPPDRCVVLHRWTLRSKFVP